MNEALSLAKHKHTWMEWSDLGSQRHDYEPTYGRERRYINDYHESFATVMKAEQGKIVSDIPGWQRRSDALKLYEMAYYAEGEILELGCFKGLSTSIMARAALDAGRGTRITTNDRKEIHTRDTMKHLAQRGLDAHVTAHAAPGKVFLNNCT